MTSETTNRNYDVVESAENLEVGDRVVDTMSSQGLVVGSVGADKVYFTDRSEATHGYVERAMVHTGVCIDDPREDGP